MKKNIAEAIGTFALVFFGAGTVVFMGDTVGNLGISIAFGLSVVAMAYGIGAISGAHLNPAVSLGVRIAGRMSTSEMIGYWIAQVIGGLIAGVTLYAMGGEVSKAVNVVGEFGLVAALIFEFVATLLFITVILGATQEGHSTPVAGMAIGLTLAMIHITGISITGVSVNPARSIATNVFDAAAFGQLWLFILVPLAGGAVGGLLHKAGITSAA